MVCGILILMKKFFLVFAFSVLFILSTSSVRAGLITIESDGEVVWNVLADETSLTAEIPRSSYIEIKDAAKTKPGKDSKLLLTQKDGKVSLAVEGEGYEKELDVTSWEDDLIEIEERPESQSMRIRLEDNGFGLVQKGIKALTDYPVSVDAKESKIFLSTSTGKRTLSVLPFQAVQSLYKAKVITNLQGDSIDLVEEDGSLNYVVSGEKYVNLFNVYQYPVLIKAKVSATTGEVENVEAPVWYQVLGYFLS
jgi:hypothetical protein